MNTSETFKLKNSRKKFLFCQSIRKSNKFTAKGHQHIKTFPTLIHTAVRFFHVNYEELVNDTSWKNKEENYRMSWERINKCQGPEKITKNYLRVFNDSNESEIMTQITCLSNFQLIQFLSFSLPRIKES